MKDPVTLCTGQTYDRANIEKWLHRGHRTCPVTMLPLQDSALIPNVIVRRLIQAWCADNGWKRSFKAENIYPSNSDDVRDCVLAFLKEIVRGQKIKSAVRGLRQLAMESEANRKCIVSTGGALLLVSLLWVSPTDVIHEECDACEDALSILAALCRISTEARTDVAEPQKLGWIVWHLRNGSSGTKLSAVALLKMLLKKEDTSEAVGKAKELFQGLVSLLRDDLNAKTEKLAVKTLERACRPRANREKAIEAGAAGALVDLLVRGRKSTVERGLATLDLLCETTEGKEAACGHPSFIPALVESLVRVSHGSTEHAIACMSEVCTVSKSETLLLALEAGVDRQLLLVLQSDATARTKRQARELLKRLHAVCYD